MRYSGSLPTKLVGRVNACVGGLRTAPGVGRLVSRRLTMVTYTGRRSGRTFTTPVGFRRTGDIVTIGVQFPQRKVWWRNFLGAGAPVSLQLDGVERTGHAVATVDDRDRVEVTVRLDG